MGVKRYSRARIRCALYMALCGGNGMKEYIQINKKYYLNQKFHSASARRVHHPQ